MKKIINNIKENYKLVIAVLVIGVVLGLVFSGSSDKTATPSNGIEGHEGHNHESEDPTTWTCSMHPQIKQDKPGKCPICAMDLIPLTTMQSAGDDIDPNEIVMSESAAKLADIQTMMVQFGVPEKSVRLQGKIHADERNISELTARFGGRIEKLFVNFTGQTVRKGEKLATIYSPNLVTAQRELLEAISFKSTRPSLYKASKGKLKLWDLTDKQIEDIEKNGEPMLYFDILSPISGTVTMRHVAIGDYVKEGTKLFEVVDLSRLWVMLDAYESDLPWVKLNDKVEFTVQAIPGKNYEAKVTYIDPFINGSTRVAKVRAEVSNKSQQLKPEMFVNGVVNSKIAEDSRRILIPKSSILWTGKRAVVYVKVPNRETPSFLYREVVLGPEAGAFFVVSEGLQENEEIAINGVFKIDAASQLIGLPSMMNPSGGAGSTPHDMSKMDMGASKKEKNTKVDSKSVDTKFKSQLTSVYKAYLNMKDGFIDSDADKVKKTARLVKEDLNKVDMALLKGDSHMLWMDELPTLKTSIDKILKFDDIKKQREAFVTFNQAFYNTVKAFGLNKVTTYYQFCPMANDNKGAYWFSNSEEIKNPYFGEDMIGCGEVKETIK
ncbi:efflux RND transporter periplasmic adaptor subunit [Labilibaculum sp. A4]|uniref:efflux RND transporter periplasmic adaptor subunit n=1 Tax=Labilibaculum euxinus TaxID=2686357 RepID=UPI000F61E786|nr:efflux RND transporter periplasmic adaptor subunit [Labilibaculum euxinus]MDQ1769343.1 efflux RND transporter periplasmic adaptor subunit [Labilibaculum euxinus]MWN74869.1 efflux RND transporter periplasmic adaptor subunit [Labilibaculum euxinus]